MKGDYQVDFTNRDLVSLLHPVSIDEFFAITRGKGFYIHRENRDFYKGLYSCEDIDDSLCDSLRLCQGGRKSKKWR